MDENAKDTVARLRIIKELASDPAVQQVAKVMIDYIQHGNKGSLGFNSDKKNGDSKDN